MKATTEKRVGEIAIVTLISVTLLFVVGAAANAWAEPAEVLYVQPRGREVFSHISLDRASSYVATVTGIVLYNQPDRRVFADAQYSADGEGNYTEPGDNIEFQPAGELIASDRAAHRYVFRFVGNGERLAVTFTGWKQRGLPVDEETSLPGLFQIDLSRVPPPPTPISWINNLASAAISPVVAVINPWKLIDGGLALLFLLAVCAVIGREWRDQLSEEERHLQQIEEARRLREQEAREAERLRKIQEDARQRERQRQKREEEECRKRFHRICLDYQIRDLFGNEEFLGDYGWKNKDRLLREANRIADEYRALHEDEQLVEMLKRERPEIYDRAIWEMRALNFAQRFDVERPKPKPEPVLVPKRKPSPEEFRDRMIRRERTRSWDKIEKSRTRLEGIIEARKMLKEYDLDPDERARLEGEIVGQIIDDEDPNGPNTL